MAHLIDETTGRAAFATTGNRPAWHGLGKVLNAQPESLEQFLEDAVLDWEVQKTPNYINIDGEFVINPDSYSTYRKDTKAILGAVGNRYEVFQNEQAMAIIEPFFQRNDVTIETAGAIKGGAVTFVVCRPTNNLIIGDGDELRNYFVIFNSHDGSTAITAMNTPVRIVCNNTLQMAISGAKEKISIRHTKSAASNVKQAADMLLRVQKNGELFTERAKSMRATKWGASKFFDYVANVFCTPAEIKDMSAGQHPLQALSTRKQNIITEVLEYAETGVGQAEAIEGTAWWAYNAITGYYAGKQYNDVEKRFNSLMASGAKKTMDTALRLAQPDAKMRPLMNLN